jgi:hypothetical protein
MTIRKDYAKSMRRRTTFEQRIWDKKWGAIGNILGNTLGT